MKGITLLLFWISLSIFLFGRTTVDNAWRNIYFRTQLNDGGGFFDNSTKELRM
jgi:hypothetical protein